ncbi:ankyrin repeat domain-containing protein 45-like [Argonauta hians]
MKRTSENEETTEEVVSTDFQISSTETAITFCVLNNLVRILIDTLNDEENEHYVSAALNERNDSGKSPLELCAILGRTEIMRELLTRGADANLSNCAGYTPAHYAGGWGQVDILKILTEFGANLNVVNERAETPKDIAERYQKVECIDFIEWAFAKNNLISCIKSIQNLILEPEKKPSKDEKNLILNTCKEKLSWIENTVTATTQEFISQQVALETTLSAVIAKIAPSRKDRKEAIMAGSNF